GMVSFQPTEISLSDVVSRNIKLISNRGAEKGIEIINNVPIGQSVYADEEMLNSLLRNLLSNAVKFTKQGGKVIVKSRTIEDEMIEISVTDSGIGMPENLHKNLFKIGEKVGRKGTDGEETTGLGLLLCKDFVEMHSGRIWVESEEGKGSTFSFTLPRSK
ncbi:MAG: ATP-binding protein, partial [Bacteroidota bacterium]|nr:ATP-binding protein [Bacteroidota bacterium]